MLPVINDECVRQAVRTGLGLKAQINKRSIFDRKNYFYPDLPQGYQISQYKDPIVGEGKVLLDMGEETDRDRHRAAAPRAGRRQVDPRPAPQHELRRPQPVGRGADGDRVSKPDLRSSDEAKAYLSKLRTILRYLGTCDGNMEQGSHARRRQRLGAQARWRVRHALRDQERQLDPLCRAGDRVRGAPPDRHPRGRRQDRPGDAALRSQDRRDALDAHARKRRTTTATSPIPDLLPLEFDDAFIADLRAGPARTARREEGAVHRATTASRPTTRWC